jgi:predicted permease
VLLAERPLAALQFATPSYFRTLEIPLRRGREFALQDNATAELVAIVNEKFARDYWPAYPAGVNPVGQQLMIGVGAQPVRIVGVVADMHQHRDTDAHPTVYRPWAQNPVWDASLVVRTHGDPLRLANVVRAQVIALDRDQPVYEVRSMEDVEEAGEGQRRMILKLLEAFGALAVMLTMVGLYGVTAYSVAQRTRELGIRRALGATDGAIVRLVVWRGIAITAAGVLLGIGGALALTRLMQSLLFHIAATDPITFTGIGLLLIAMALAACYVPARRAAGVSPMTSLRVS